MHKGFHCQAGGIRWAAEILPLTRQMPGAQSPTVYFTQDIFTSLCYCSRGDLPAGAEMSAVGSGREGRVSAAAPTLELAGRLGEAFCFQTGRALVSHCAESACLETIMGDGNRALPTAKAPFRHT